MPLSKDSLRKEFSKNWKEHYELEIFRRERFERKICPKCLKAFWTLDPSRILCGDPPCENYGFIGKPMTKGRLDYVETWKLFEKFFRKNGHESVPRYPVIDRWRPDLYFTIASIQDFQRIDQGRLVMEYPADPLVVPQVCLRFNDVPNVGVTGRHHTCFIMSGQHSFGNYWKDRCIELNFKFLTEAMGIPKEKLTYIENMWSMPDFSQFGPCIETFAGGLELVNSVFSQYTASGSGYAELPQKVIDVGWGHERLVWFANGTATGYDAVFGPVTDWMKKQAGLKSAELFKKYAVLAGGLDMDEQDVRKMRESVANALGVTTAELAKAVEPMQAIYAIADHVKALLFAVADGGIPSNVGGGYNLRVLLRRSMGFIREFGFQFSLDEIAKLHAKQLKPLFPELAESLEPFSRVVDVEKKRYEKTTETAGLLIKKELKKGGEISADTMARLYTSNGITPELVEKVAAAEGVRVQLPEDFYAKITECHISGSKEGEEKVEIDVSGIPATRLLFYETPYAKEFDARVISAGSGWAAFDQTCFFSEGGGQPGDRGKIVCKGRDYSVADTRRMGDVVLHKVAGVKAGDAIHGTIDWDRRSALMRMHTGTHILAGSARKVIGRHVWQAGAQKGVKTSRIDLTHYSAFTDKELAEIEKTANDMVRKNAPVSAKFMPRGEAEKKYGFVLYQGGASPGKQVRVVEVGDGFDVEACAGTHLKTTGEVGEIRIIKSERIQDGVNRLEFACGTAAHEFGEREKELFNESKKAFSSVSKRFKHLAGGIDGKNVSSAIAVAAAELSVEPLQLVQSINKFSKDIAANSEEINRLRKPAGKKETSVDELVGDAKPRSMGELAALLFSVWKKQAKMLDELRKSAADGQVQSLLAKEKDGTIFEATAFGRKEMIATAEAVLKKKADITVILLNRQGEVVVMSGTKDAGSIARDLCQKAGGSGGGSQRLGQGRADFEKMMG